MSTQQTAGEVKATREVKTVSTSEQRSGPFVSLSAYVREAVTARRCVFYHTNSINAALHAAEIAVASHRAAEIE